jgi:hypothetical protein
MGFANCNLRHIPWRDWTLCLGRRVPLRVEFTMRKINRLRIALKTGAFWKAFDELRPVESRGFAIVDDSAKNEKTPQKSRGFTEFIAAFKVWTRPRC